MKKATLGLVMLAMLPFGAMAGETAAYRVTYTIRGVSKQITLLAESPSEARRTVQDLFPGCYVTGTSRSRR